MEQLVDELERNYRETQDRMSDPAVYNDHREAAEVGRRLKELETPYKLAERWRSAAEDLGAARSDAELAELLDGGRRGRFDFDHYRILARHLGKPGVRTVRLAQPCTAN